MLAPNAGFGLCLFLFYLGILGPAVHRVTPSLALVWLMGGDLAQGLRAYEARRRLPKFSLMHPRGLPPWKGGACKGGLLVVVEQGLGDTLQYSRWIRRLRQQISGRLILAVQRPLVPLLSEPSSELRPRSLALPFALPLALEVECERW